MYNLIIDPKRSNCLLEHLGSFFLRLKKSYKDEPRPEYAPKKNSVNKPRAASPPTVATIQRGTLPISLILIIVI